MPDSLRPTLEAALGAQYAIQRLLGRGGIGAVYLAVDRSLERLVAIKVLSPDVAGALLYKERFRREAIVAGRLAHPNIVPLYAFGEVHGLCYYVMGYVRGESLAERLQREGPLACDAVRRIVAELGDALHYAHRHGVVHRDIKPGNVLLDDETGRALLADFGIARSRDAHDRLSVTGVAVGTPHYMSPEQALGSAEVDGRSDIYSLGVLAYVMLTGREPFTGENARQVALAHVTREPPSVLGFVIGAAAGAALGWSVAERSEDIGMAVIGTPTVGLLLGTAGAIAGWHSVPERWEPRTCCGRDRRATPSRVPPGDPAREVP